MICVQLIDKISGKPLINKKVSLCFNGITRSGFTENILTNNEGCAFFNKDIFYDTSIYVDGKKIFEGKIIPKNIFFL